MRVTGRCFATATRVLFSGCASAVLAAAANANPAATAQRASFQPMIPNPLTLILLAPV
jgi:hypothetical protein